MTSLASSSWPGRRSVPVLPTDAMHFWAVTLDALLGDVDAFRAVLAPDEIERAARFHFERDASRYVACRGVLRRLLASYGGAREARDIALRYGAHGKPALVSPDAAGLRFNVAHSGGFALLAFTRVVEPGVDVERLHEISDLDALMRTCFAPTERAEIAALSTTSEKHDAFFRCWTRKEAVLKALGWGLAKPLDSFEVTACGDRPRLLGMSDDEDAPREWQLRHLIPAAGYIGAAAWIGPELKAECFTYES